MARVSFTLNGEKTTVEVEPAMPLLWVLRDELHLTGTKFGCGVAACGACTTLVNGRALRSCVLPAAAVADAEIVTIEGLARHDLHPAQQAWIEHQAPQCGYCQPGILMAMAALLDENPAPSERRLAAAITNVCRCGSYQSIRRAARAIKARRESEHA